LKPHRLENSSSPFEGAQTFETTAETYTPTEQFGEPTLDTATLQESSTAFEGHKHLKLQQKLIHQQNK